MRFCNLLKTRFTTPNHAYRSSRRPLLERLEDRVVPSITDGTLLVATLPSTFSTTNQSSFPTGILGANPSTGAQSKVSMGKQFSVPTYIAEAPSGQLYVTDLQAFTAGAVIRVDPNTGKQTVVAKGGLLNGPNVLVFKNGYLYVANEGDASGTIHSIVRIDPTNGQQTLITSGGGFTVPVGMASAPGNNIYVADEPGNVGGSDPGKIWLVSLDTGRQTLVSSNNSTQGTLFNHPVDIAVDASGNLVVGNTGSASNNYAGSVIRVNPQTGAQTLVSSFGAYTGLDSIEVGRDGTIFVGAIANGTTPGRIYSVNPVTGAQRILASGGMLSEVEGIRQYHTTVTSGTAAPAKVSVPSLLVSQAEAANANLALGKTSVLTTELPQAQPVQLFSPLLLAAREDSGSPLRSAVMDPVAVSMTAIDSFFLLQNGFCPANNCDRSLRLF